jgi:sugar transferase (PEP-CTERM system associated)
MVARLGTSNASLMLSYQRGPLKISVVSAAFIICMYSFDLYDSSILGNRREVLVRLTQVLGTAYLLLALLYYLYPPLELGRGIFQIGFLFVAMLLLLWRKLFAVINSVPQLAERALILGNGPLVEPLVHEFESRPELGVRVVGRALAGGSGTDFANCGCIEPTGDLLETNADEYVSRAVKHLRVNNIVIAMDERRGKLPVELLLSLKCHGVRIQDATEVYEAITGKVPIECIRLGSLLLSPGYNPSRYLLICKQLASGLVSIIGLLVSLPLLPVIYLAIKLTSPGPVLYRQKRVGCDGVVFNCYKFRTMDANAEADTGPTWAGDDDPRITPVGRVLRLSRMDEIPQLWNVLRGEMSLVGPRPERPEFVEWLRREIPYYYLRHSIRPGITGWAQIRYKYGNTVHEAREKLKYDLFYIKHMSLGLDLWIFLSTVKVVLFGQGAK